MAQFNSRVSRLPAVIIGWMLISFQPLRVPRLLKARLFTRTKQSASSSVSPPAAFTTSTRACWRAYGQVHSRKPKHHRAKYARCRLAHRDQLCLRRRQTGRFNTRHAGQRHLSGPTARPQRSQVRHAQIAWIGSVDQRDLVLYMRADAPWKSLEDMLSANDCPNAAPRNIRSHDHRDQHPGRNLGAKFHKVRGYPGGVEIDLAIEKGEIHCRGTGITTHFAREPYFTWHKTGFDRHIVQTGAKKDPRMPTRRHLTSSWTKTKRRAWAETSPKLCWCPRPWDGR